jgi:hypothetical protein
MVRDSVTVPPLCKKCGSSMDFVGKYPIQWSGHHEVLVECDEFECAKHPGERTAFGILPQAVRDRWNRLLGIQTK